MSDEQIIFKYFSENITESTKQSLTKAFEDIRIQTRAEGWIKIESDTIIPFGKELLVITDYTAYGRKAYVQMAALNHADKEIRYGGINSILGTGVLIGLYWSLPAIIPYKIVTHYRLKPELPND